MFRHTLLLTVMLVTACGGGGGGGGDAPAAPTSSANPDTATVNEDRSVDVSVADNDVNVDSSTVRIASQPSNGQAHASNGLVTYTPTPNFNGTDNFTYRVNSTNGTGNPSATVTITVNPVNDSPSASDDNATTTVNTPVTIAVIANDEDVDHIASELTVATTVNPTNGRNSISGNQVTYTPDTGFTGTDSFSYSLTDPAGASSRAEVTITVNPITTTSLSVSSLTVPTSNYVSETNNALDDVADTILVSESIEFEIGANPVSFVVSLIGPSTLALDSLAIIDVTSPDGTTFPRRQVIFCDLGLCTIQVPKTPNIEIQSGTWSLRLGTLADSTDVVAFEEYELGVASRVGPAPEAAPSIAIKPHATGNLAASHINEILNTLVEIAADSDIILIVDPLIKLTEAAFAEVDSDFRDASTSEMVMLGDLDKVNLYFIESFSGAGGGGLLGISGGLPGSLGIESEYNGVLINATATSGSDVDFYLRTTAEITFHEVAHLLGLYHTSESDGELHDIIDDTPECTGSADLNDPGSDVNFDECPDGLNPMFWEQDLANPKDVLTDDQRAVMRSAPIVDLD